MIVLLHSIKMTVILLETQCIKSEGGN